MKLVLPDEFDIKITPKKNGKFCFEYQEFFGNHSKPKLNKKQHHEIVGRTISVLSNFFISQFGPKNVIIKRSIKKNGIYLKINDINREQVSNFIVGEFINTSSLGNLTIRNLMESAIIGAINNETFNNST